MALFRMKPHYRKRKKELSYYGTASTPLSNQRGEFAGTCVDNYALFGGGYSSYGQTNKVVAYDKSLICTNATTLSVARSDLCATRVKNYAIFGGGGSYSDSVDAYDNALIKISIPTFSVGRTHHAATHNDNYAIFGGGMSYGGNITNTVEVYNNSLTKVSNISNLSYAVRDLAADCIGDYVLFGGGYSNYSYARGYMTVYDSNLTRLNAKSLTPWRDELAATHVEDYSIFGAGSGDSYYNNVNAYSKSLVSITPSPFFQKYAYKYSGVYLDGYAIFSPGGYNSKNIIDETFNIYDNSLTLNNDFKSVKQEGYAAIGSVVGNYALFAGGAGTNGTVYYDIDVFQVK